MAFCLDEDDDGRVLEAALAFVDRFDCPSSVRTNSSTSLDADELTKRAVVNAKKRILRRSGVYSDPNRARNERRREMQFLRQQLEKLQIDLQILQKRKPRPLDSSEEETRAQPELFQLVIPNLWQVVADKQRQRREESEQENMRLKLIAGRQQQVADSLSNLLKKRTNQLTNDCSFLDVSPRHQVVHVVDFRGDIGDFQGLFRHLEAARQEVDVVFVANGLANMVITPSDVHIREGQNGKYLEAFSNKILPFKPRATSEAAWEYLTGTDKHMGNGSLYEKAKKDLDEPYTVIEEFTKEVFSNSSRADVKMKQVVRRYVEADRDIVIWVANVAPTEIKHKMLQGLAYHLRGYALTKRSAASTPSQELSQLQFCYQISFDRDIETRCGPDNMQALTDFLLISTAQNLRAHQNSIENLLVDQALRP